MDARKRRLLTIGASAVAAAGSMVIVSAPASAATFEVTNLLDAGAGSLRQAIIDANGAAGADVITFQTGLAGTITLTTGELFIDDSVTIQGPGASVISVSGNDTDRVLGVSDFIPASLLDVTISGLTIRDGEDEVGAGVFNGGENLTLDGVVITDNHAVIGEGGGLGGGVYSAEANNYSLIVTNSSISGNVADVAGGGLFIDQFEFDIAAFQPTGGGAPRNGATLLPIDPGDIAIIDSTISGNNSVDGGGAFIGLGLVGEFIVDHSTVSGNTADTGGGFYFANFNDQINIHESTISGNQADGLQSGGGGGIFASDDTTTPGLIEHSTIAGNTSSSTGGGIMLNFAEVNLDHVLLGDNSATVDGSDIGSIVSEVTLNYSLVEDPDGFAVFAGANNIIGQDPQLGALQDNGGPTLTHLPALTSPAVDTGNPALTEPVGGDQRHATRVVGAAVDIGAVETVPPPVNDAYVTAEDTALVVPVNGVLGNDPDPANSTVSIGTLTTHGTVVLNADGSFTYTPDAGYNGPDSFTYVQIGSLGQVTGTALVSITVTPVNDPPVAVDDSANAADNGLAVPVAVLTNDSDPDGDTITVVSVTQGTKGVVAFTPTGVTYTPNAGSSGIDTFTYTISDGALTDTATVTISIAPAPTTTVSLAPPVAELPETGGDSGAPTGLAIALLGAGAVLTAASRRRRRVRLHR